MALSPADGHPYQALAADLVTRIQRGDFKPDNQLPPIRRLAAEYAVTIATAQRAMQHLAADGYVKTVPGLGSFALDRPIRSDEDSLAGVLGQLNELASAVADLRGRVDELEARFVREDR